MNRLGARMKELRHKRQFTQTQLAIATKLSLRGIQQYELGERRPAYHILIDLADFFNVSIDYLVGRSDNPEPPDYADTWEPNPLLMRHLR